MQVTAHGGWPVAIPLTLGGALGLLVLAQRSRRRQSTESFRDQVVLITGGGRGFGLALARRFAMEGARLVLLGRNTDELTHAATELQHLALRPVLTIACDVRHQDAVERAVAEVRQAIGPVDVLVNNAGVIQASPLAHVQLDDFRDSLHTHFWGALYLVRACLPDMRARRAGHIVNISSIGGRIGVPHLVPYAVGKFALTGFSEGLHAELKQAGIAVTTVTPHLMRTGSHRNVVVRGQHWKEAVWFALSTSSGLTAVDADRAARDVVEAIRRRRARVSPGWQARVAEVVHAVAPETTAAIAAWAATHVLPGPAPRSAGDQGRVSRDLDMRPVAGLFPTAAARRFNQEVAPDEASVSGEAQAPATGS